MHKSHRNGSSENLGRKKPATLSGLTPYISVKTFQSIKIYILFAIIRKFAIL